MPLDYAIIANETKFTRLVGIVTELHPKSNAGWSRFRIRQEDSRLVWVTAKFGVELNEVIELDCTYSSKFHSYDAVKLVDGGEGKVSNTVVILKLVELLDGVGQVKARRLGEKFPELFVAVCERPQEVAEACGASVDNVVAVGASLTAERANLSRVTTLADLGYPHHLAKRIAPIDEHYKVAEKSPYAAIRLVTGLGWLIADEIGRKMGVEKSDSVRIDAGINHYWTENVKNDGHTRAKLETLLARDAIPALLGVSNDTILPVLENSLIPLGEGWYTTGFARNNAEIIARKFLS